MDLKRSNVRIASAELNYQAVYSELAFDMLSNPLALYKSLTSNFAPFGCTLGSLGWENPNFQNTAITCNLSDLGATIRIRIDKVQIEFPRLHELATPVLQQLLSAIEDTLKEASPHLSLTTHLIDLSVIAVFVDSTRGHHLSGLANVPPGLGNVEVGIGFYAHPTPVGQSWKNLVLDRVFGRDDQIAIRLTGGIPVLEQPLETLATYLKALFRSSIADVGLDLPAGTSE
jgi:hypothetical protein